tara:strand:+ start:14964 stop:16406 length:1443 start_codon:yes stop_codon:yes gene_type:complete
MKTLMVFLCLCAPAQAAHPGVFEFLGGTAFVVEGDLLVTALHVVRGENKVQVVDGVRANLVHTEKLKPSETNKNSILTDGLAIFKLTKTRTSLEVASAPPLVGSSIKLPAYPRGEFAWKQGVLRAGDGKHFNIASFIAVGGDSGGPLLNEAGQVIGVVLASNPESGTLVVGQTVLVRAIQAARTPPPPAEHGETPSFKKVTKREVVVFSSENCPYCDYLKADIRAGHFSQFNMIVVDNKAGVWSDQDMYAEFLKERDKNGPQLAYPVIWIRGTPKYTTGYLPSRRGGLIGFIGSILDNVAAIVVGQKQSPPFPLDSPPKPLEDGIPIKPRNEPPSADDTELRSAISTLKADIAALKDGSFIEKFQAIRTLRSDIGAVKTEAAEAVATAKETKLELGSRLSAQATDLREDIAKAKSSNPFLKVQGALALKKDIPNTVDLVKDTVHDIKSFDPVALIGLIGALRAYYRRRKQDKKVDLQEIA